MIPLICRFVLLNSSKNTWEIKCRDNKRDNNTQSHTFIDKFWSSPILSLIIWVSNESLSYWKLNYSRISFRKIKKWRAGQPERREALVGPHAYLRGVGVRQYAVLAHDAVRPPAGVLLRFGGNCQLHYAALLEVQQFIIHPVQCTVDQNERKKTLKRCLIYLRQKALQIWGEGEGTRGFKLQCCLSTPNSRMESLANQTFRSCSRGVFINI